MDSSMVRYWEKVKDTIHTFDNVIAKFEVEGMAVLIGIISVSGIVYEFSPITAGMIVSCAFAMNLTMLWHCNFYYNLLIRALDVAIVVEKELFSEEKAKTLGLTHALAAYSRKPVGIFGEARGRSVTVISHIIIGFVCVMLALFYFGVLQTP